jgi:hypothetical protein
MKRGPVDICTFRPPRERALEIDFLIFFFYIPNLHGCGQNERMRKVKLKKQKNKIPAEIKATKTVPFTLFIQHNSGSKSSYLH